MPFLGQDWRSDGEQWVKTNDGWERLRLWRLKLFDSLNENVIARLMTTDVTETFTCYCPKIQDCHRPQPHVFLHRVSKEQKMEPTIGDTFSRLDMTGAVKDIRRFNYVAKLVDLFICHKLCSLSGTAQKLLFNILDEILNQVTKTQNNVHIARQLLIDLKKALEQGQHNHVGSSSLWARHQETVNKMQNDITRFEIQERDDDGGLMLSDLPDDCIRKILVTFTDHKDIVRAGMTETRNKNLTEERKLWKELCLFHFDNIQIHSLLKEDQNLDCFTANDWKNLHNRLVKRYGTRDLYADMLHLCRNCQALYWGSLGHPCLVPTVPPMTIPVTPIMCMELFSM